MVGNKLAHYTVTGKLGEGGMGVVYEAIDSHLDRAVALKVLPHDALANPARKQRFVQEAKTASALNHPHIVTIYDIDRAGGIDYIAMELIRGRTLEQALSRGKLRLPDALKYGVQIADALAAAHAAGIVHRDLKPGNVMITERGDVKVLDFGLAKLTDDPAISEADETLTQRAVTAEGTILGSAPYMSPEQAEGRKVDGRSDIFSFGSVLYEMLTGKRAFQGANCTSTMAAILKDEPEPASKLAPDLPREVERLVARCLRKDLDRRSQSMAEIRIALQELKEESESGSLVTPAAAAVAARPRPRWPYVVGAALVVAATAAFATFLFLREKAATPLAATVLTSFVGYQGEPSLSPDGNQFAFTWDGDVPNGKPHVYISLVGKGTPLRLTAENEAAWGPSWSADGQSIALVRQQSLSQAPEIHVMPALGGPSRRIASGLRSWNPRSSANAVIAPSWSPDARWLLWGQFTAPNSNQRFVQAAPASGGEVNHLMEPPTSGKSMRGHSPAISPDGRELVWERCDGAYDCDLFLAAFQDGRSTGTPRQLTHDHKAKRNPLWTHDGKEIVYIAGEPTSELSIYRLRASGGDPRRIEGIGANATNLAFAAKSNRLLYSTVLGNYHIRRVDLNAADAKPERFLSSTRFEGEPSYSPDGKRIAFSSNRGGVRQIWVADTDGANLAPLTSFPDGIADYPKWSSDGQFIAFEARPEGSADIYTAPAGGGPVKRLTDNRGSYHAPAWARDGKWIYFTSTRGGATEIFRIRPDGSAVQQITHDGGYNAVVAPDGKWLYYFTPRNGLWKMPLDGGEPAQSLSPSISGFYFAVAERGIYVVGAHRPEGYPLVFYPFDGGRPRTLMTLSHTAAFPEISPDGRWMLYTTADDPTYEIMLVENFR